MRDTTQRIRAQRWGLSERGGETKGRIMEALPYLIVLALFALMMWSLTREKKQQKNRTAQEYERDLVNHRNSMMRAAWNWR